MQAILESVKNFFIKCGKAIAAFFVRCANAVAAFFVKCAKSVAAFCVKCAKAIARFVVNFPSMMKAAWKWLKAFCISLTKKETWVNLKTLLSQKKTWQIILDKVTTGILILLMLTPLIIVIYLVTWFIHSGL